MHFSASLTTVLVISLPFALWACGPGGPGRVPTATIFAVKEPPTPTRAAPREPVFSARAQMALELTVMLPAAETRRSVRVWLAESEYRAAHAELCSQLE